MSLEAEIALNVSQMEQRLGDRDAYVRCIARLGVALHLPFVRWYEDEAQRSVSFTVPATALSEWFGQMVGTMIASTDAGHAEAADEVLSIARKAIETRLEDVKAGRIPKMEQA